MYRARQLTPAVMVELVAFLLPVLLLTVLYSKIFREVSCDHVQGQIVDPCHEGGVSPSSIMSSSSLSASPDTKTEVLPLPRTCRHVGGSTGTFWEENTPLLFLARQASCTQLIILLAIFKQPVFTNKQSAERSKCKCTPAFSQLSVSFHSLYLLLWNIL